MNTGALAVILLVVTVIALVGTGMIRRPGIGILATLAVIGYLGFRQSDRFSQFGFFAQDSWIATLFLALVIGTLLALIALIFIEPLAEKITGQPHDITVVEDVRGNFITLVQWILVVWVLVGFIEELIYRGFLMRTFIEIFGSSSLSIIASLLFSSIVFGLSHYYQGSSGAISATIVGLIIGLVFIYAEFNLWLVIFVHGFIDTVQLILIYFNKDHAMRGWLGLGL